MKLSIVIAIILIGLSVFYYFIFFLPHKENLKIEQQRQEQLAKEKAEQEVKEESERKANFNRILLNACLSDSYDLYKQNWNSTCVSLGKSNDCTIPTSLAERWDGMHEKDKEECFKKYPQK